MDFGLYGDAGAVFDAVVSKAEHVDLLLYEVRDFAIVGRSVPDAAHDIVPASYKKTLPPQYIHQNPTKRLEFSYFGSWISRNSEPFFTCAIVVAEGVRRKKLRWWRPLGKLDLFLVI